MRLLLLRSGLVASLLLVDSIARAEGPFDGKWSMSPMSETYSPQKWGAGCGPPPVSGSAGGGGTVTIRSEGSELVLVGGLVFRTTQCWDPMPTLHRDSHSASARAWQTRCSTPPGDPRRAVIVTSINALSDTRIQIVETGRYEMTLEDGQCIADVRRGSMLTLLERAGPPPAPSVSASVAPVPASAPQPSAPPPLERTDCASPGDPVRLEVRPAQKLMRPGETFVLRAVVSDDNGCPTTTALTFVLEGVKGETPRPTVDSKGKIAVPTGCTDGRFVIAVTAAGRTTRVTVDVASATRYGELLTQPGFNAEGEKNEASVAVLAKGSIGGADARPEDLSKRRRLLFVAILAAAASLLGGVAMVGFLRARRVKALERTAKERHEERLQALALQRKADEEQYQVQLQAHLESVAVAQQAADGVMSCPSCMREFPSHSLFCPHDATRLVPRVPQPARGKICPVCGNRYDGSLEVCGKDGTVLVLLN